MTPNSAYLNVDPPDPISSTLYEDIDSHPQKLKDYNVLQQPQMGEKVQYEQPDYSNIFPSELCQTVECGQQDTLATDSADGRSFTSPYDDIIGVSHPQTPKVEDYNVLQHKPQTLRRVEKEEYQVLGEWESQHNI